MIAFTFRKRFTGRAILFAALCLFVFGAAQAQNPFTVTGETQGTDWNYGSNLLTITANGTYDIYMATSGATTTTDRIQVNDGLTNVNITLNSVSIDLSAKTSGNNDPVIARSPQLDWRINLFNIRQL